MVCQRTFLMVSRCGKYNIFSSDTFYSDVSESQFYYGGVIQNRTVIASVQATSNEPLYDNPELDYSWMSVLLKIQISK